ncbi:alpha/beta hydrolase [Lusitaniella coriacea]|uniref:alpha/beta hydrolase n=1 Tax=Lusitaniella coriacea TaxID=1983105 RepID=UPI003CF0B82B
MNQQKWNVSKRISLALLNLSCVLMVPTLLAPKALSAEKILLYIGPLEFSLAVESLEAYATDGTIGPDLAVYINRLTEEQREQFRELLTTPAELTPVAVAQFLYSPQGETILREVGKLIQTRAGQSGFYAIRSALILAAADPEGLTPLNVLKKFPTYGIRINSDRVFGLLERVSGVIRDTEVAIAKIEQISLTEAQTVENANFPLNLGEMGAVQFNKQTLTLNDLPRKRAFFTDLYLPQKPGRVPLIVISHGLGSDRQSYEYLATHLASHGFAVAVPEHPGSNDSQLQALANGLAKDITPSRELIDRPLDIQFLLDELEQTYPQQIDWQKVGAVGQSFGAYTVLALAGAQINFERLQRECDPDNPKLNISFVLQCQALDLPPLNYNLKDDRVKAVIAMNPIASTIFGASELNRLEAPLMLVTSTADAVTPALDEQILPFSGLTIPNRYLVMLKNGTHFSTIGASRNDVELPPVAIGPNPAIAYNYMESLSVAFFNTHINQQPQYNPYLSAAYAQSISDLAMPLSIVQSLSLGESQ